MRHDTTLLESSLDLVTARFPGEEAITVAAMS